VVILALLNRGDAGLRRALEEHREFQILTDGELTAKVGLENLLDLNPQEFTTTMATSIGAPKQVTMKGVELRVLLDSLDIDTSQAATIAVSGLDGYVSPLTPAEVNKADDIYICYSLDGEILKTMSEGGMGPFLMVIRSERFAQRWCKYVESIDIK